MNITYKYVTKNLLEFIGIILIAILINKFLILLGIISILKNERVYKRIGNNT